MIIVLNMYLFKLVEYVKFYIIIIYVSYFKNNSKEKADKGLDQRYI